MSAQPEWLYDSKWDKVHPRYTLDGLYLVPQDKCGCEFYLSSAMPPVGYDFYILTKAKRP